jgi:hypothetical protein
MLVDSTTGSNNPFKAILKHTSSFALTKSITISQVVPIKAEASDESGIIISTSGLSNDDKVRGSE